MNEWASAFRAAVIEEILSSSEPQVAAIQQRLDAKEKKEPNWFLTILSGLGLRVLSGLRRRLVAIPGNLARIGQEVATLVRAQTARVLEVPAERISVASQVEGWVRANVQLIQGLQEDQLRVIERVLDGAPGQTADDVVRALLKELDITAQRARFIATDQILKLNAAMTQEAHRQLGVRRYKWRSREDEKVRSRHRTLAAMSKAGATFSYDDPPVSEDDGSRHNPGEGYSCRCYAQPVLE